MTEETNGKKKLQWHAAFFAEIQIELAEDADKLVFENEHQLSTKPMSIDVLIIKKLKDEPIRKNIGRIFRRHNIIEYKSPEDYLSIDDFYKVVGYACIYKADVQKADSIKGNDITVTFVCRNIPAKMIKHLQEDCGYGLEEISGGIYYISGGMFPMQLVVTSKLSKEENFWLRNLTNDLKENAEAESIITEYEKYNHSKLHKSVMDIIVRANEKKFKEVRTGMCDALVELMADIIEEKVEEQVEQRVEEKIREKEEHARSAGVQVGHLEKLREQIQKKLTKGKTVAQIADELEETEEKILELMEMMKK